MLRCRGIAWRCLFQHTATVVAYIKSPILGPPQKKTVLPEIRAACATISRTVIYVLYGKELTLRRVLE